MKTKTTKSKPGTEDILDEKLSAMETRIEQKIGQLATKEDLKKELGAYATKEDLNKGFKEAFGDISKLFYEKLNAVQNSQDKLLKKFENWEQENTVGTEQIRELRVDIDGHEVRLKSLENAKN
jgi:hypothetical protein